MKLNSKVLAKMIREELARAGAKRAPKKLAEIQVPEPLEDFSHGGGIIYDALQELKIEWLELGDEDPSVMANAEELGIDPGKLWALQVEPAIAELESRWAEAYNEVQEKLINGDFFPRTKDMR